MNSIDVIQVELFRLDETILSCYPTSTTLTNDGAVQLQQAAAALVLFPDVPPGVVPAFATELCMRYRDNLTHRLVLAAAMLAAVVRHRMKVDDTTGQPVEWPVSRCHICRAAIEMVGRDSHGNEMWAVVGSDRQDVEGLGHWHSPTPQEPATGVSTADVKATCAWCDCVIVQRCQGWAAISPGKMPGYVCEKNEKHGYVHEPKLR